jgi:hypothetical protein
MKKLFLTTALLLAAITTANAQSLKVGNVTISYNAPAAENIGFTLDVTNAANGGIAAADCAKMHKQQLVTCKSFAIAY